MGDQVRLTAKKTLTKRNNPAPRTQRAALRHALNSPAEQVLFLQRAIGNQAVQRLFTIGTIQTKLRIGQPNDIYEQEADRVADEVMRMPEPAIQAKPTCPLTNNSSCEEEELVQTKPLISKITPLVQRQPIEEKGEKILQTKKMSNQSPAVSSNLENNIQSLKTEGAPLPESTRAFFEPRFGHDFSKVKLHTNTRAAELARTVNAKAFTVGKDVIFGSGQYSPETDEGRKLMAHELTHVVQQNKGEGNTVHSVHSTITPGSFNHHTQADAIQRAIVQRDLAQTPTRQVAGIPALTGDQIRDAIEFNNRRYSSRAIRLIQNVVGGGITGRMSATTVRLIALMQAEFGLPDVDGKVGADTFNLLVSELTAERVGTGECMTMFRIIGPGMLDARPRPGGRADIASRFQVRARFSPRCGCENFEYRQFICGDVVRVRGGVRTPQNNLFTRLPAGQLLPCPDWREDGDTSLGSVGPHYGHRNETGSINDSYTPQRRTGCEYQGVDVAGLRNVVALTNDRFEFNIRYFGDIRRRVGGRFTRIERKFWRIGGDFTIP